MSKALEKKIREALKGIRKNIAILEEYAEDETLSVSQLEYYEGLIKDAKEVEHELTGDMAPYDLIEYAKYISDGEYIAAAHHRLLCEKLMAVERGDIKRLLVCLGPGSAKSTYGTLLFSSWYMGKHPTHRMIMAGYNGGFAKKWGKRIRNMIDAPDFMRVFNVGIDPSSSAADEWNTTEDGEFVSKGVGSGIAGVRANLIVIDDPIANRKDAESKTKREELIKWYEDDLSTRLVPSGAMVLIQTRWHEEDLAGYIIENEGDDWEQVIIPSLCEDAETDPLGRKEGEAVWPTWQTAEELRKIQARNPQGFSGLYQQRPVPDEGGMFKRVWLKYYASEPTDGIITMSVDTANKDTKRADYTVATIWKRVGKDHYLLKVYREKLEFVDLVRKVKMWAHDWSPNAILIEDKASGQQLIQTLNRTSSFPFNVISRKADSTEGKILRAEGVTTTFEARHVFLPERAEWTADFEHELLTFPLGKYDDQVDSATMYLNWAVSKTTVRRGTAKLGV